MNIYLKLIFSFAKIGACTFGGGMAMLPILQREVVEKQGWVDDNELADYFAIGQCTPGIIAVNTATFVGYKKGGVPGGILATLGLIAPSIVIIAVIAGVLEQFSSIQWVAHALAGIRACVCVLIFQSTVQLGRAALADWSSVVIFTAVLICSAFFGISPVLLVVTAGICGVSVSWIRRKRT